MYEIGVITTTHGIKGEVKVKDLSDFDRFKKDTVVYGMLNNKEIEFKIENIKHQNKNLIVKFYNYNNINDVLIFKGLTLYSKERAELLEDEFYFEDLLNLKVYDNLNNYLGIVSDIMDLPHGEVIVVTDENKRTLIPFEDEFIAAIDAEKIVVNPIEGLL